MLVSNLHVDTQGSSAYTLPAGMSIEELDIMRKLEELHLRHPFKSSRCLRDDLWHVQWATG